jgi:hypothetical protein
MTGTLPSQHASEREERPGEGDGPRNLAAVTETDGAGGQPPRRRAERLFGAPATPSAPRPERVRPEAPRAVRWAAVVVGVEAAAIAVGALVLLYLTVTSTPDSLPRALAEVVAVGAGAAVLAVAARGIWRVSGWARSPVVVLQLLLGALAYTTVFQAHQPAFGIPVLVLVAAELYLLATPEARLAFWER